MESNLIDHVSGSIVVLDRLLTPDIKNFNDFVGTTGRDASTIGMEFDGSHSLIVIMEGADVGLCRDIPHLYSVVFRPRAD